MSSSAWRVLGADSIVGSLRADLREAEQEVVVVGPWVDDYFTDVLVRACRPQVQIKLLTRPLESMSEGFREHAREARRQLAERGRAEVKISARLHAKIIVVDERLAYCGSANWYRYSLEESQEIVLRGPVADVPGVLDEWTTWWTQGEPESLPRGPTRATKEPTGYQEEIPDPIAAAVLAQVPKSFVLRAKKRR